MRLEREAVEQIRACLTQAGVMMKKVMDISSQNDDNTIMEEAIAIGTAIEVLNVAILERDDHVSITDEYELYGSAEEDEEQESDEPECSGDCMNCEEIPLETKIGAIVEGLLKQYVKGQGEKK